MKSTDLGKIEKFINDLISDLPQLKFAQFGLNNFEPIWGSNYYHYLSKTKMALNISRGKYQNKYSSDRISSLIGNGLLVFLNEKTQFQNAENVLISNVTANEISNKDELKKLLIDQIEKRVRWRESVINMINNGVKEFIEIGPGKVLSGLIKRINRDVKINTINNISDIEDLKI